MSVLACHSVCLFVCVCVCLSVSACVLNLFKIMFVRFSMCVYFSACHSVCLCVSVCASACVSKLCFCVSVCVLLYERAGNTYVFLGTSLVVNK